MFGDEEMGRWGDGERGSEGVRESIPNSTLNTQHSTLPTLLNS
jgi:hypothetical protein